MYGGLHGINSKTLHLMVIFLLVGTFHCFICLLHQKSQNFYCN